MVASACRDAKSCVSREGKRKEDWHDALMLDAFVARETQDIASLLLGTSDMAMGKIYLACGGAEGAAYMYRKTKNGERKHYFGRVLTFTVFFSNFVC